MLLQLHNNVTQKASEVQVLGLRIFLLKNTYKSIS